MVSLVNTELWAPSVGRFILAMGSIESVMRRCVLNWTSSTIYKHTKSMGLNQRIDLVMGLVEEQPFPAASKASFSKSLAEAKSLIPTRNTVAHHPLALMIFVDVDRPLQEGIFPKDSEEGSITLEVLQLAYTKAEKVASDLEEGLVRFRSKSIDDYLAAPPLAGLPTNRAP
ncbi:hypothetical protein J2W32_004469 [Variovorax boronicumulans]|uniref:Uncharacterized protein n=1 Tax=Variovorax boronicumulans TaxID=436515 RepID=A0AAW8D1L9_9BURK|nr:hypothetical protein [Variovorax boronicumulans]MDP9895371.1 hypothetical protein [Variovorax boronicumulans]MDQ0055411.1 hypothetical protein [Variovorax boronicumulans]